MQNQPQKKREIFLEKRAKSYEKLEKDKLAQKIREISKADILNEAQQEVKFALKPHVTSDILHIEVTDPDLPGQIKDTHDQGDIETEMKNNLKTKFVEVYDTSIPHKPFITWFGHDGITNEAKMLLNITFISPPVIHPGIINFFTF